MSEPLPLVDVEQIVGPLRDRIDLVAGLGGDLDFYRWAANAPAVTEFYWGNFYRDLFFRGSLPVRLKELVRLRLAGMSGCTFCSAGDRASAADHGVSAAEIDAVLAGEIDGFSDIETGALRVAAAVAVGDPGKARADLAAFTPEEGVELVIVAGVLTGVGRMLLATGFLPATCSNPHA